MTIQKKMKHLIPLTFALLMTFSVSAQTQTSKVWSLASCIDYAITNNITVKQSQLNEQSSEINLRQSLATRAPTISGSASQSLNRGTGTDPITYEFVSQTVHSSSFSLNAQVALYNGNKVNNTIKQNNLLVKQNSLYSDEAKKSITLSVTEAYLQVLYAQESIRSAENSLNASEKQLERTKALYESGAVAGKDLAEVKSQYATDQYTLVAARNTFDQQLLSLKQLLEFDPQQSFEVVYPEVEFTKKIIIPDRYEVYEKAVAIMPEIKSSQLQGDVEMINLKIAKAGYQPTLSLTGALSTGYTNTQDFAFENQLNNNFSQRLGLSLSIPIFNNLRTTASVQKAEIAIRSASLDVLAKKKELYKKIENAYQSAIGSQSEMEAASAQVDAAKEAYELTQLQFNVGLVTTVDLLINQNEYLTAQQKYLQTKYNTILYYLLLQFYQGNEIKL
ncbi:MAG: TolC family protein [Marivirga sp.]|nr:TolC family protein [Marivirga sp.]